jgi:hypothetical protein
MRRSTPPRAVNCRSGSAQQAHAAGFHEGHEHVAAVGSGEFQFDFTPELRQTGGAGEER